MSNHNTARRSNRKPSFSFHAPARQENTKSGSLFVFGDSSAIELETSDYEGIEMPVMHRRGAKPTTPDFGDQKSKFVFVNRDLAPADTLASISLQYGCPVAELKRANNIYSEQDFHGRVQLRIPVPIHSLMTDPEEQARMQPAPGTSIKDMVDTTGDTEVSCSEQEDGGEENGVGSRFGQHAGRKSAIRAEKFLRRVDEDVSLVKQQIDEDDGIFHDEQSQLLSRVAPNPDIPRLFNPGVSTASKEMDYANLCGLTWRHLVVLGALGLGLAVFFLVVMYRSTFKAWIFPP